VLSIRDIEREREKGGREREREREREKGGKEREREDRERLKRRTQKVQCVVFFCR
jgi:hypothetical protein